MNKLYEFGSSAKVIIRWKNDYNLNGYQYYAGEPYTILENVDVELSYDSKVTEQSARQPLLAAQEAYPKHIVINNVEFTKKIADLIMTAQKEEKPFSMTGEQAYAENGIIYVGRPIAQNSLVFVYNDKNERINAAISDDGTYIVIGAEDDWYKVFYEYEIEGECFSLDIPHFPYFSLEIIAEGNIDKTSGGMAFLKFPSASLVATPAFGLTGEGIMNSPLVFELVYGHAQGKPQLIIGG